MRENHGGRVMRQSALDDFAWVNARTIDGTSEKLLERDHVMPRVEKEARKHFVLKVREAHREVVACDAWTGHRIRARELSR